MRASAIPAVEASFATTGIDSKGFKHTRAPLQVTIPGSTETVDLMVCELVNGDESFFYKVEHQKKRIVLHFTAGYIKGDIAQLTQHNYHVSVPFVVARDGTIYNLWTSRYWAYHLGEGAQGGNTAMSQASVAIEISNIGYLRPDGADLVTSYSKPGDRDPYCTPAEGQYYTQIPTYRGEEYFASFTDAQYASVVKLVRFLTQKYNIPRVFLPEPARYELVDDIANFAGITSHVNYRSSGKWDIGPAFDWNRVVAGVTAP